MNDRSDSNFLSSVFYFLTLLLPNWRINLFNYDTDDGSSRFSGPFYVMMAPQDVLQSTGLGQRTLVPRSGIVPKLEPGSRVTRDDRRRATHNEGSLVLEMEDIN